MYKYFAFLAVVAYLPVLLFAQQKPIDFFPPPGECGVLRAEQFYNLETNVKPNEFPWLAKFRIDNITEYSCIGILIHKSYVLTTAYCNLPPPDYIELGSCDTENCIRVRDFEGRLIHPRYIPNMDDATNRKYNIGMIRFKTPVVFTPYISPICLPREEVGGVDFVAQQLPFMDLNQCRKYETEIEKSFICSNTCDNGSRFLQGSILMAVKVKNGQPDHYFLVGLQEKHYFEGCVDLHPDIFLRIDGHVNWIMNQIIDRENP